MDTRESVSLYLEKLNSGDPELAPMVCQKLSQQLVYVPVIAGGRSRKGGQMIVQVVKLPEGSVPVFTTEEQYRAWATSLGERTELFTAMGGDLCTCVGNRATVVLDIGSPHSTVLDLALMELISKSGKEPIVQDRSLRMDATPTPEIPKVVSESAVAQPAILMPPRLEASLETPSEQASPAPVVETPAYAVRIGSSDRLAVDLPPVAPENAASTTSEARVISSVPEELIQAAEQSISEQPQREQLLPPRKPTPTSHKPEAMAASDKLARGRANPTSIMPRPSRPRATIDEAVHRRKLPPALPQSTLAHSTAADAAPADKRPVIKSEDPDAAKLIRTKGKDDGKKSERRSLLKYLGG